MGTELKNFIGVQVPDLTADPAFDESRLGLSTDPDTGKIYKVTIQQWIELLSNLSVAYKGAAQATTDPGTPTGPEYYIATAAGTYTNFKDSSGTALAVSDGEFAIFSYDGTSWSKQIVEIDLSAYFKKDNVVDNLTTADADKALSANQGKILGDILYDSAVDVTGIKTANKAIYADDGTINNASSVNIAEASDFISVVPGQKIIYTGTVVGSLKATTPAGAAFGMAGYDATKTYVDTQDSNDLNVGNLWSYDRYCVVNGLDYSSDGKVGKDFTGVEIIIPDGVYFIRACSLTSSTDGHYTGLGSSLVLELKNNLKIDIAISKNDIANNKDQIDYLKGINNIENSFIDETGDTGVGYINPDTGEQDTSDINTYEFSDFIAVTPGQIIKYSGTISGSKKTSGTQGTETGIAGYASDSEDSFISTLDSFGISIGNVFSNDRYCQLNGLDYPATGHYGKKFTSVQIVIPAGVNYIRASSLTASTDSVYKDIVSELKLEIGDTDTFVLLKQNVVTLDEKATDIDSRVTTLEDDFSGNDSYKDEIAQLAVAYSNSTKEGVNPPVEKRFQFVHLTDVHYHSTNSDANMVEMFDFADNDYIKDNIDAFIFTGDQCNGLAGHTKANTISDITDFIDRYKSAPKISLNLIGNHDDNISYTNLWHSASLNDTSTYANALTKADQYANMMKPLADLWSDIKIDENVCYYYVDFADYGIRVIGLDCYDLPLADDGTGKLKYDGDNAGSYYGQTQIDWLQTTLAGTPAGYAVIILNHEPLVTNPNLGIHLQSADFIPSVVNAWKNGTTYNHSYTNSSFPELNTSKVFDFTSRGDGEFICYLVGHMHVLQYLTAENFSDQNIIVTSCMWSNTLGPIFDTASNEPSMMRGATGNDLKNHFQIISVDRNKKKICCVVYGAYRDVEGRNKDRVKILNY